MTKEYITKLNEMVDEVHYSDIREKRTAIYYKLKGYISALETLIK